MGRFIFWIFAVTLMPFSCVPGTDPVCREDFVSQEAQIKTLERAKLAADSLRQAYKEKIEVFVSLNNADTVVRVLNEQWPEQVSATYNVVRDSAGNIIMISYYPHSTSGDWFAEFTHYFNPCGYTYALQRSFCTLTSSCETEVACEHLLNYFSSDFIALYSESRTEDENGYPLKDSACITKPAFSLSLYQNLAEFLNGERLPY